MEDPVSCSFPTSLSALVKDKQTRGQCHFLWGSERGDGTPIVKVPWMLQNTSNNTANVGISLVFPSDAWASVCCKSFSPLH